MSQPVDGERENADANEERGTPLLLDGRDIARRVQWFPPAFTPDSMMGLMLTPPRRLCPTISSHLSLPIRH